MAAFQGPQTVREGGAGTCLCASSFQGQGGHGAVDGTAKASRRGAGLMGPNQQPSLRKHEQAGGRTGKREGGGGRKYGRRRTHGNQSRRPTPKKTASSEALHTLHCFFSASVFSIVIFAEACTSAQTHAHPHARTHEHTHTHTHIAHPHTVASRHVPGTNMRACSAHACACLLVRKLYRAAHARMHACTYAQCTHANDRRLSWVIGLGL